ncbi:allantoin racemase [Yoonia maritima]|uniref:Allantoin racemase n=1 Tax=Yoonia maritima TaxID=1435347 RepID=A0A2T0VU52_9RHOB|nr:aspartate/glutamate racemase family protein [Yoonia maritima]PRY74980.1 allantoin racemase [Yoonia maritima]
MKIALMNPNATSAMTQSMLAVARAAAPAGVQVSGWTNSDGPKAIQGREDGEAAIKGLLAGLMSEDVKNADLIIIACFDDVGLTEMRRTAHCPVIAIGQAAYTMAVLMGHCFSVVTSTEVSIPIIEENIEALGFAKNCKSIRASGLPVLTIEQASEATCNTLSKEILIAKHEDGASTVILGCAGMAALHKDLEAKTGTVLIDGVRAGVNLGVSIIKNTITYEVEQTSIL